MFFKIIELWTVQGNGSASATATSTINNKSVSNGKAKISSPYNMVHVTHVGFNPQTGEFTGMPREWHVLLQQSGITKKEQRQNPQVKFRLKIKNEKVELTFYYEMYRPFWMYWDFTRILRINL
jgi:hypothetical protein